jgi:ferric-dicitrate binding protein FerR (iron transport regulator)
MNAHPPQRAAPDRQALEEAADWLIRLSEGELSDPERAEWDCWKASTPERGRAGRGRSCCRATRWTATVSGDVGA